MTSKELRSAIKELHRKFEENLTNISPEGIKEEYYRNRDIITEEFNRLYQFEITYFTLDKNSILAMIRINNSYGIIKPEYMFNHLRPVY